MVEYALILALVSVAAVGILSVLGTSLIAKATADEDVCAMAAGRAAPAANSNAQTQHAPAANTAPNDIGKALGKLFDGAK